MEIIIVMQKIILASQSPQRRLLLDALGIKFEIQPANIDEKSIIESNQKLRAQLIAQKKARKIASINPNSIVIAADTFTIFNEKSYEKPVNNNEAIQMLSEQSGKKGKCLSGFAYIDNLNKIEVYKTAITELVFRQLTNYEINKYVAENPVTTWSAAFCPAYPAGINLIASIKGSLSSFTHGLPMEFLVPLLEDSGVFDEKK